MKGSCLPRHVAGSPRGLAVLAVAGVLSGCIPAADPRPVGSECARDADCDEGLVCAYDRCRSECSFDRDCPAGGVCVTSETDPDVRVCTLDVEANCAGSDLTCPDGLSCAPDGRCRLRQC